MHPAVILPHLLDICVTMAFADPQSITYNAVAKSLVKVPPNGTPGQSQFRQDTGEYVLTTSHVNGPKRTRHLARLDHQVVAADPLTAVNAYQTMSAYIVVDIPLVGFSLTDQKYLGLALTDWLSASSAAKLIQLLAGE